MCKKKTQDFMYAINNANFVNFINDTEQGSMKEHLMTKLAHHGQFGFFFQLTGDRQLKLIEWVEQNYKSGF